MKRFLLHHRHDPEQCGAAFAAWRGFVSPLRHETAASSCLTGGHAIWWCVQADDATSALALLPAFVAQRTELVEIRETVIP